MNPADSVRRTMYARARRHIRSRMENTAAAALQRPTLRAWAFNVLHLLTDSASATVDGLHYTFSTDDWIIGRSLYIKGRWDTEFMEGAVTLLAQEPSGRKVADRIFVDVGANIGTTTLLALQRFGAARAVAIEPNPQCLPYLHSNIAANRFSERCRILEMAVSDAAGELDFRSCRDNSGGGMVLPAGDTTEHLVPCRRLDDILAQLEIAPEEVSVVWVDTEGHEFRVLRGADRAVCSGVPFIIEFWPQRLRDNGEFDSLVRLLTVKFAKIIDLRAHVQQTREPILEPTVASLSARADALGPWPTDLLLLP